MFKLKPLPDKSGYTIDASNYLTLGMVMPTSFSFKVTESHFILAYTVLFIENDLICRVY